MTAATVTVWRHVQGPHWGLGDPAADGEQAVLIGWSVVPAPDDAGVPAVVADVLIPALLARAWATFRTSRHGIAPVGGLEIGADRVTAPAGTVLSRLRGDRVVQVQTRSGETLRSMFDDPVYPWWLAAQAAVLSDEAGFGPALTHDGWDRLLGEHWAAEARALAERGAYAVFRAGVDGDVAGLWCRDDAFRDHFLADFRAQTERAGVSLVEKP